MYIEINIMILLGSILPRADGLGQNIYSSEYGKEIDNGKEEAFFSDPGLGFDNRRVLLREEAGAEAGGG
jgi:hypothetical protein